MYENKLGRVFVSGKKSTKEDVLKVHYYHKKGYSVGDISLLLGFYPKTIKKFLEKEFLFENGAKGAKGAKGESVLTVYLKELFGECNSLYLKEVKECVAEIFGVRVSESTLSRLVKEMGYSRKKIVKFAYYLNTIRVQLMRKEFRMLIKEFPYWLLCYVDECSFRNKDLIRNYGYGATGKRVRDFNHKLSKSGFTLILGIGIFGVVHYKIVKSKGFGCTGEEFNLFLELLFVKLPAGTGLFIDGASIHNTPSNKSFLNFFEKNGIFTIKNAPYSPDYAPVELFFNAIKNRIKKNNGKGDLQVLLEKEIEKITESDCTGFFRQSSKNWSSEKI